MTNSAVVELSWEYIVIAYLILLQHIYGTCLRFLLYSNTNLIYTDIHYIYKILWLAIYQGRSDSLGSSL